VRLGTVAQILDKKFHTAPKDETAFCMWLWNNRWIKFQAAPMQGAPFPTERRTASPAIPESVEKSLENPDEDMEVYSYKSFVGLPVEKQVRAALRITSISYGFTVSSLWSECCASDVGADVRRRTTSAGCPCI
jgi:hypothetical protein